MKGTSSVRRVRLGSFGSFYVFCNSTMVVPVCVVLCVCWSCGCRSHWNGCMNVACRVCFGEEAGARNLVFFRVKWLQPAMKGTSCVRRVRLGSFGSFYVFCNNRCSCMRSSMRFLKLWLQIALEWLHEMLHAVCCGEEAGARNLCVFPCKVAAAGDERYLVCAAGAAGVVWFLLCVLQECLFLCA